MRFRQFFAGTACHPAVFIKGIIPHHSVQLQRIIQYFINVNKFILISIFEAKHDYDGKMEPNNKILGQMLSWKSV
jgi:hypothetical protein